MRSRWRVCAARLPAVGSWAVDPLRGLVVVWTIAVVVLMITGRLDLAMQMLVCAVLLAWFLGLAMAAVLPPPPPLHERSALVARLLWLWKATWATVAFGLAAAYGALASVQFSRASDSSDAFQAAMWEVIRTPLFTAGLVLAWIVALWLAVDLRRTPPVAKQRAAVALIKPCVELIGRGLARWLIRLLYFCSADWLPLGTACFGPMFAALAWTTATRTGSAGLWLW